MSLGFWKIANVCSVAMMESTNTSKPYIKILDSIRYWAEKGNKRKLKNCPYCDGKMELVAFPYYEDSEIYKLGKMYKLYQNEQDFLNQTKEYDKFAFICSECGHITDGYIDILDAIKANNKRSGKDGHRFIHGETESGNEGETDEPENFSDRGEIVSRDNQ